MRAPLLGIACLAAFACPLLKADEGKTGSFETTFSQRSPLSELKALTKRLKVVAKPKEKLADYDLSKEHFLVYVPEKYDPATPMGLIVLANYKPAESLPTPILPQLADANVALVVPKEYLDAWWKRAGLTLDIAFNMQQLYKIDRKRIYVFGGGDWPDAVDNQSSYVANRVGLFFPEVFTGTLTVGIELYRPFREGDLEWKPQMPRVDAEQIRLARLHPLVMGEHGDIQGQKQALGAYKADGFKNLKVVPLTMQQFHYPNYTTDWVPDVLKYMDSITANLTLPAEKGSATKPAATRSQ